MNPGAHRHIEQGQMQVGQRRRLRVTDMSIALHTSGCATGYNHRQISVVVDIWISNAAAVEVERMVQQRAIAFRCVLQFLQKLSKEGNMERIDLCHPRNLVRIIAVVGKWMVWIRNTDFRIGAVTGLPRQLECDDTSDIRLEREQLEIEH